ncbi:(2Fe-2S)-binding protein [Streptomyces sp. NPDC088116]|uniref:(2Fe-2S)-binding protein n=1 Tax=Streptomyces sp. NPDC088116 TaxID=3365825 RepID=UPI00381CCD83
MTTNEHSGSGSGQGPGPEGQGAWQPIPQGGEYDAESTAFVQLPPEDVFDAPLAAPGHGYVPPQIMSQAPPPGDPAAVDPSMPGGWAAQHPDAGTGGVRWPEPHLASGYEPQAAGQSGQWNFTDRGDGTAGGAGPATGTGDPSELTGHWAIPVAQGDLPDESGEFSTSVLASQWNGGNPPTTLPGGAAAPWAALSEPAVRDGDTGPQGAVDAPHVIHQAVHGLTEAPEYGPGPAGGPEPGPGPDPAGLPGMAPEGGTGHAPEGVPGAVPEGPGAVPEAERTAESLADPRPDAQSGPEQTPDPAEEPLSASSDSAEHPSGSYILRVNGADRPVTDAWIGESLLYVLRERLGLAGAKDGCSQGECGACNVQVDGRLVASCLVPAATAAGSEVRTVEGLAADGEPSDVQRALAKCGAVQCGFCIPGMAMTVHDLLEGNHAPSELETRQALCGNLCRCSGYRGVLDAVSEVVTERTASAEAAAAASEEARIPHQAPPGAGSAQPPHSPDGGMA